MTTEIKLHKIWATVLAAIIIFMAAYALLLQFGSQTSMMWFIGILAFFILFAIQSIDDEDRGKK
jgi:small-conductance mechanosensitive channel